MDFALTEQSRPWRPASYSTWNEWLVEHTFSRRRTSEPVEYIPASLEDLCSVVGERPGLAQNVLDALSRSIVNELIKESSTLANYLLRYRQPKFADWWSPNGYQEPYFFACLWLTCLVSSGYPAHEGNFNARMALVLGKGVNFSATELGSLDDVWEDLAKWTRHHRTRYRELILPPPDNYRRATGRSFFLAFPNRQDRQRMWRLLAQKDLLGVEPPISLVIEALLRAKSDFSTYFQRELKGFIEEFLGNGGDPRNSAFWRAVRQAVLTPQQESGTEMVDRDGRTVLMARFDQDELLEPYVACNEEFSAPGFRRDPLDIAADRFQYRLQSESPISPDSVLGSLLTGASRRAFTQGLVPLLEIATGEYILARGEQIAECDLALVRADRVVAFVRAFGGQPRESALNGWMEIIPRRLHQLDALPPGLNGVTLLLPTTEPPKPHFIGGLRTSTGAFYRLPGYMPRIRAPGADKVDVHVNDASVACTYVATDPEGVPEWLIPESQSLDGLDELHVTARWHVCIEGHALERIGETRVPLADWSIGVNYKGIPGGDFRLETTSRQMCRVRGPLDEIPLRITTTDRVRALDMLFFDATARWLGPGVGEMSLVPQQGFPWLAVGPKKAPNVVVFVGDPKEPVLPDGGAALDSNDRRHWKQAFSAARTTLVRKGADYIPLSDCPEIQHIHASYVVAARTKSGGSGRTCTPTNLNNVIEDEPRRASCYSESSRVLVDVLSTIACRRSGVPLREVHEHLARLTRTSEQHSLRLHLVRAFAEAGAIDTLLRVDGRQTLVVARRPRLVLYRMGHRFRATIMGLLPSQSADVLRSESARLGVDVSFSSAPNPYQPPVIRLEAKDGSLEPLEAVTRAMGFAPLEFLDWPDTSTVPEHFAVHGELRTSLPPDMYEKEATWCWKVGAFLRTPEEPGEVSIERRRYGKNAPIYVIVQDGAERAWSYSRAWALLDAAEKCGRKPFALDAHGILRTVANSPMHLPLPLARLCAIVGVGAPGPQVEGNGSLLGVTGYQYPFGKKLVPLVLRAVPSSWT